MATDGKIVVSHKTHYARLGHATQHIIPKIMQELLRHYIDPKTICLTCRGDRNLWSRLKPDEMQKIAHAIQKGYSDFDIPLIYTILRNLEPSIRPTKGWNHPTDPGHREYTIGDDIERFRRTRNHIIHRGNTSVTDQELHDYFDVFKGVAGRFERILNKTNNEFVSEFEKLKTCCMDETTEKMYLDNLKDLMQREKENEERYLKSLQSVEETGKENEERILQLQMQLDALRETVLSLRTSNYESIHFIKPLEDKTCFEGETASLECIVAGEKKPSKWFKNESAVISDNLRDESRDQIYKLTILNATREDEGEYKIKIGDEICHVWLSVIERPPSLVNMRNYQQELAEIALKGENTIICAGTNAGKTYVAFHIIECHLLKNPKGKVVFINKTNVLLGQQHKRACETFTTLHTQGKIKMWKADEDLITEFANEVKKSCLIFLTPKSLSNHLVENSPGKVSIEDFSLIVLDECHHTHDRNLYNEVMSFYRIQKFQAQSLKLPQILGLTASPGTRKAKDATSAVNHLKKVMANLDVSKLSVVKQHKEELLKYCSIPEKVKIASTTKQNDPVRRILFKAMEDVEHKLNCRTVTKFILDHVHETLDLQKALDNPPIQRTEVRYIQWIAETKEKVEHILHKDSIVPRLLHACLRHLELYAECLEINSLLEIDQVRDVVREGYALLSYESQNANTNEEREIVTILREVFGEIREIGRRVESNPDIKAITERIDSHYQKLQEDSRFLIFVKTRATAKALSERLPDYLRSTYLTGSHKSVEEGGVPADEQLLVVEKFTNGEHLCVVATSVACEGLDIPRCNVMIRYKFRADEISSVQMRGRIRQKEGTEVLIGTERDLQYEELNIKRQYLMEKAIERVYLMDQSNIERDIKIAERNQYDLEEIERTNKKVKISNQRRGVYSILCKYCGTLITDGSLMRHINQKLYIVYDKEILSRVKIVDLPKKKMKTFDNCQKRAKVYGGNCGHDWGILSIYRECSFVCLSQDKITFLDRQENCHVDCKKWSDLKFAIDELTDNEVFQYNTC